MVRHLLPALVGSLLLAGQLGAQGQTGSIMGRVVDATTQQPIATATVRIEGTQLGALTQADGAFALMGVPAGTHRVRASLIGYAAQVREVTVEAGASVRVEFTLSPEALQLRELVVTGYGTQRREAITGSVARVDADVANVGVQTNPNDMLQGRAAGLRIVTNNGEPGAGAQIRIRGGTSISASNEPLYVIDGVPVQNVNPEPGAIGIDGTPAFPRSPLNMLNPSDIESIVILKDAAAGAIYGAQSANGVVLIETRRGARGGVSVEYDGYVASSSRANDLGVLTGSQYRAFVQEQVAAGNLPQDALNSLGSANTSWENALTRNAITHNHNLSFAGGTDQTRYRASLNYMNQEGVVLNNGLERIQARVTATHQALDDRLRLSSTLNSSHLKNNYLPFESGGGFEGGVFVNMAFFNPTFPVRNGDGESFFEVGEGVQSVRNPVALAEQIQDLGTSTTTFGNIRADLDLVQGVTGTVNFGVDRREGIRRMYFPKESPVGARWGGRAGQIQRDATSLSLSTFATMNRELGENRLELVGGYEYKERELGEFGAGSRGFVTDAFGFNNIGAGSELVRGESAFSWREESRIVSFFSRANFSFQDRFYVTGVLRHDGSSRFGADHKWSTFPAISASWRLTEEEFLRDGPFSHLTVRAGWGKQGNEAVQPYTSLTLLGSGSDYVFGGDQVSGVAPVALPNPGLKWEATSQTSAAVDFGLRGERISGTLEYYVKNTSDLLLMVPVAQPAPASERLENVGKVRNSGIELSLDALLRETASSSISTGLVLSVERGEVQDLGPHSFIRSGFVSGQGMSGQVSQRIMPGEPLGTFFGPTYVGVDGQGRQLFACDGSPNCVNGQKLAGDLTSDDFGVIGDANPDFMFGLRTDGHRGNIDFSLFVRGEVGMDVFNNTALVYATKSNSLQGRNFLSSALNAPDHITEPAVFSSRWIESGSYVRLQNVTIGYTMPSFMGSGRTTRLYVSGDNLLLITGYSGLDPEVHSFHGGLAVRGIDYLAYPRARTFTVGVRAAL